MPVAETSTAGLVEHSWIHRGSWLADFTSALVLVIGIICALGALATVGLSLLSNTAEVIAEVPPGELRGSGIASRLTLPAGSYAEPLASSTEFSFKVVPAPMHLRLAANSGLILTQIFLAAGCWLLWRLLRTIGRGEPFDPRNSGRLVWLGVLAIGLGIIVPAARWLSSSLLIGHFDAHPQLNPIGITLNGTVAAVLVGLVFLAVASAFARGTRLTQDVDGLV